MLVMCQIFLIPFMNFIFQTVGFRAIWYNNSGFDLCPFHVHAVFMSITAVERRTSIFFQFFWEAVNEKYLVEVWDYCTGPSAADKAHLWVLGVFINCHKCVLSIAKWSLVIQLNLLPWMVQ